MESLKIPIMKPRLPSSATVSPFLQQIDDANIYSNFGPLVKRLEKGYSEKFEVDPERVVVVSNATLALQGLLEISNLKEWFVPNFTFAASVHAAVNAKKIVRLLDVSKSDFQINMEDIDNLAQKSIFGLLPVLPFGAQIDFGKYSNFDVVVFDAAASLGAPNPDFNLMKKNWSVVYSLHATKVLGAGEGAVVVTGTIEQAHQLRQWCNFGFLADRKSSFISTNAKMPEVIAAYGLASLEQYEVEKAEWEIRLSTVSKLMLGSRFSTLVDQYPGFRPYWIIRTESKSESVELSSFLNSEGIETRNWWAYAINEMPAFSHLTALGQGNNSKLLADTLIGLPMWRDLPVHSIELIVEKLKTFELGK